MKPLIKFPLEGDESILVEVEELPTSEIDEGLVANYPGQQVIVKAQTSFADAMDKIKPVAANILVTAHPRGIINLWSRDVTLLQTLDTEASSTLTGFSLSPDGKLLALSFSSEYDLDLWSISDSIAQHLDHFAPYTVSFSPDGQIIASASQDGRVKFWSGNGSLLTSLNLNYLVIDIKDIIFSPNGKTLALVSNNNTVTSYNLDMHDLLVRSCDWLRDYLENPDTNLSESDRKLCDGLGTKK